jgi:uncharacterized protein YecT (DUF1311 family)
MIAALILAVAVPDCQQAITQTAMTACAGQAYRRADAALNTQWARTLAFMKKRDVGEPRTTPGIGYAAALLASQRAWIRYRDAECLIEGYAMRGGTAEPMARYTCLAAVTDARTKQLRSLLWDR